ncbi:uncharacterized protein LOC102803417 [Saccoglossus kowalevskii]|uniref:Uncharacterized protein LOC102803417 n=1 Tax=Saccoglossus kowalevskii TaxID=10224 RepID=A0ABM0MIF4_SACKO|nr:PREDICTED: uncharacterized protein LOC102803417 [Saccoglossus kowalevskii]
MVHNPSFYNQRGFYENVQDRPSLPYRNEGQDSKMGFQIPFARASTCGQDRGGAGHQGEFGIVAAKLNDELGDGVRGNPKLKAKQKTTAPVSNQLELTSATIATQPKSSRDAISPEFNEGVISPVSQAVLKQIMKRHKSRSVLNERVQQTAREAYALSYHDYKSQHDHLSHEAIMDHLLMKDETLLVNGQYIYYTSVEFLDENGKAVPTRVPMCKGRAYLTTHRLLLLSNEDTAEVSFSKVEKNSQKVPPNNTNQKSKSHHNRYSLETSCSDDLQYATFPIEGFLSVELQASSGANTKTEIIGSKGCCARWAKICCFCFYCFCCCEIRSCMKKWDAEPFEVNVHNNRYVMIGALIPPWAKRTMIKINFDSTMRFSFITQFLSEMQLYAPNLNVVKLASWNANARHP